MFLINALCIISVYLVSHRLCQGDLGQFWRNVANSVQPSRYVLCHNRFSQHDTTLLLDSCQTCIWHKLLFSEL